MGHYRTRASQQTTASASLGTLVLDKVDIWANR
jgi:hypothetical protein